MGALGPVYRWIPEDDLLLKNAVESGASLESLAKGAVKFSQKYTVRELQERWYSILYDPVVSAEASARMTESERLSSAYSSKASKVGASKEKKCATEKRKVETVRSYYEAQRKRMCSEAFDAMDLSFLVGPSTNTYDGEGDEPLSGNYDPGDPISNPFRLQAPEPNTMARAFPGLLDAGTSGSGDVPIHTFPAGLQNLPEENFQIDQNNMQEEISHFLGDNTPSTGNISVVVEMGEPSNLPDNSLFEVVDQVNGDQPNVCLDFEGNKIFNSPVSGCVAQFNNMEYSPLPGMGLPVDIGLGDKDLLSGGNFLLPGDYDGMSASTSGYDVQTGVKVEMETAYDSFQVHNSPEDYLAEISNSLLNFTNEEELLFMDGDGKDIIDKTYYDGLSSLLLNSPNDTSQEHVADATQPETSAAADVFAVNLGLCTESNKVSENCNEQMSCDPQIHVKSSIPSSNHEFPELKDGVICCVLNTEDPNIPCNEDISLLRIPLISKTTMVDHGLRGGSTSISSPVNGLGFNQRFGERRPNLMQKEQNRESRVSPPRIRSLVVQEMGPNLAVNNFRVSGMSRVGSELMNAANNGTMGLLSENQKDKAQEVLMTKHPNSADCTFKKSALASASVNGYPHTNSICIKEEHDVAIGIRGQESKHADPTPMNIAVSESVLNTPTDDQNVVTLESDGDIPYYSDIEAMILDMDLDPDVHDLLSCEEVSGYQHEGTKKTIVRLEQSAHAHVQRAIGSHGAIAILYGRHSKHYIKKSEVLLGRATNEDRVDIDLGREGNANKVSRKQAIIKMDKGGYFTMKNLSESPIWVNNKEIGFKQSVILNSSCLIEIRGMPYIFESNQTRVKMYLDSTTGSTQI